MEGADIDAWLGGGHCRGDEDENEDGGGAGAIVMVNYYSPHSLSVADYEVYTLRVRGKIKERFVCYRCWHGNVRTFQRVGSPGPTRRIQLYYKARQCPPTT